MNAHRVIVAKTNRIEDRPWSAVCTDPACPWLVERETWRWAYLRADIHARRDRLKRKPEPTRPESTAGR